ncbi:MAG: TIGR00159 family protein [Lachnospiraceae bacterium]|nr:TIGR00159 family protein [Lachnospiraceae bacterium]
MRHMQEMFLMFKDKYLTWLDLPMVTVIDIVEIIIIAFLFYTILVWIKSTRAWMLFKGLMVILVFVLLAAVFQMNTILWLAEKAINVGVIAIVIIFQPELRRALEQLGRKNFFRGLTSFEFGKDTIERISEKTINELVRACFEMSKVKTGALIVVEDSVVLSEYERTGIDVDAVLTNQLLINIFEKNTPLHDGAIIVRGERIVSATCYLPLSDNLELSKELGTRHRAAVGISEVSDSVTIVVSEETGGVSIAAGGRLIRGLDQEGLRKHLKALQKYEPDNKRKGLLKRRLGGKNAKQDDQVADK